MNKLLSAAAVAATVLIGSISGAMAACTGPAVMHDFPGTAFNMSLVTNAADGNCSSAVSIAGSTAPLAASGSNLATNSQIVGGQFLSTQPTMTNAQQAAALLSSRGELLVAPGVSGFAVQAAQSGTWNITNISGTVSLPTGAATAAKQPALGTAGTASADVITVQGIASMTALKVDGSAVTQPVSGTVTANLGTIAGVSTAANQSTEITALNLINTNLGTLNTTAGNPLATQAISNVIGGVGLNATPTLANGNGVVPTQGGTALSATNGGFQNLLQGNAVLSTGNPLFAQLTAGAALIGKVGIDQTTPGTTNAVSATNFPTTVSVGTGAQGASSPRVTVATDTATVAGSAPGTAGTPSTNVVSVQGVSGGTPEPVSLSTTPSVANGNGVVVVAGATGGATPAGGLMANTNNSTNLKPSAGTVNGFQTGNINASTPYYLKLYDKATAPTCGTDTPVKVIIIPPSNSGNNYAFPVGLKFATGIGFCVVTGIANNDNTSVPASTVLANIDWN